MKKIIFATVPMLPEGKLARVRYRKENTGELFSSEASFPSIPMIEWNVDGRDEVKLVVVMTQDDNNRSQENLKRFQAELRELSNKMGIPLDIHDTIVVPHEETVQKQYQLFRNVCRHFENDSEVLIDITYGTKVTSIGLFAALAYAEKLRSCLIKHIYYGKFAHDDRATGELYDIRCLYELNMAVQETISTAPETLDALLEQLWG